MLTKERFFRILELLDHKSFITIQELMEVLNASKSTVNRDLIELEKQGLIQRERGGAIKKEMPATLSSYRELPVMDKEHIHSADKDMNCAQAVSYTHLDVYKRQGINSLGIIRVPVSS